MDNTKKVLDRYCGNCVITKGGNCRRASDARPRTHVSKYTTEIQCVAIYGIFKRQEQSDDI